MTPEPAALTPRQIAERIVKKLDEPYSLSDIEGEIEQAIREPRATALREAAGWHQQEIGRLDEIESHPPGLTEYGHDARRWHEWSAKNILALLPASSPEGEKGE